MLLHIRLGCDPFRGLEYLWGRPGILILILQRVYRIPTATRWRSSLYGADKFVQWVE